MNEQENLTALATAQALANVREPEANTSELFRSFDRQMQRMFKGIVPRNQRHKLLQQAVARANAEDRA